MQSENRRFGTSSFERQEDNAQRSTLNAQRQTPPPLPSPGVPGEGVRPSRCRARAGRTAVAVLAFLLLFAILLVSVSNFYLLPAMSAAKNATPDEKRRLMAFSRLLLMLVLFILFVGLVMTFRVGRFFFPRATGPRVRTKYVDVWAEAGQRLGSDEVEDQEVDEDGEKPI